MVNFVSVSETVPSQSLCVSPASGPILLELPDVVSEDTALILVVPYHKNREPIGPCYALDHGILVKYNEEIHKPYRDPEPDPEPDPDPKAKDEIKFTNKSVVNKTRGNSDDPKSTPDVEK